MIIEHILSRHGNEPLNNLYYAQTYPDLHAAACRIFGSWKDAIENCGLNYNEIRKYRTWSKTKILDEIKNAVKLQDSTGAILDPFNVSPGSETTTMLSDSITLMGGGGAEYTVDTGSGTLYTLTTPSPLGSHGAYFNGMRVSFLATKIKSLWSAVAGSSLKSPKTCMSLKPACSNININSFLL